MQRESSTGRRLREALTDLRCNCIRVEDTISGFPDILVEVPALHAEKTWANVLLETKQNEQIKNPTSFRALKLRPNQILFRRKYKGLHLVPVAAAGTRWHIFHLDPMFSVQDLFYASALCYSDQDAASWIAHYVRSQTWPHVYPQR